MLNVDAVHNIAVGVLQYLNMFNDVMLTYQCFISRGHNWQLVCTHFTYGVAIQEIEESKKHTKTKLCAMHLDVNIHWVEYQNSKLKTATSGLLV